MLLSSSTVLVKLLEMLGAWGTEPGSTTASLPLSPTRWVSPPPQSAAVIQPPVAAHQTAASRRTLGFLFVLALTPETKGRSLARIEADRQAGAGVRTAAKPAEA